MTAATTRKPGISIVVEPTGTPTTVSSLPGSALMRVSVTAEAEGNEVRLELTFSRAQTREVATDAVIEAWAAAYGQLADLLIGAERAVYESNAAAPGGWAGAREFRVSDKRRESEEITSFVLTPADGGAVMDFKPGQYIGLKLVIDGEEVRRNYSLSAAPNGRTYRISVKREAGGRVVEQRDGQAGALGAGGAIFGRAGAVFGHVGHLPGRRG